MLATLAALDTASTAPCCAWQAAWAVAVHLSQNCCHHVEQWEAYSTRMLQKLQASQGSTISQPRPISVKRSGCWAMCIRAQHGCRRGRSCSCRVDAVDAQCASEHHQPMLHALLKSAHLDDCVEAMESCKCVDEGSKPSVPLYYRCIRIINP